MKLSSVCLIAAALVAIAGTTNASGPPPHEHRQPAYSGAPARRRPSSTISPERLDGAIKNGRSAASAWGDAAEKAKRLHLATRNRQFHTEATTYERKQTDHSTSVRIHQLDQQHFLRGGKPSQEQRSRANNSERTAERAQESERWAQQINLELDGELRDHHIDFEAEKAAQRLLLLRHASNTLEDPMRSTG